MQFTEDDYISLCRREGWDLDVERLTREELLERLPRTFVIVEDTRYPLTHPYEIHLTLYRKAKNPSDRFFHMKKAHDFLWPAFAESWNHWDERRFEAHCEGFEQIVLAGGAGVAKSHSVARIASIFWLSNPKKNACLIASTTLESLESRIWGYVAKFMNSTAIPINIKLLKSKPPKILHPDTVDKIHGMFAVAVNEGSDDSTIGSIIGRHPDYGLMVVLDEATDMNPLVSKAFPNLRKGIEFFQLWGIGNSNSHSDLHGALATPAAGWDSIDPNRDKAWKTCGSNGVCLYFNPYDSPAIVHPDPRKREYLAKFLPTKASIEKDKEEYGEESDSYYRFVLGFWKKMAIENTVLSEAFVSESEVKKSAEWSGFLPLEIIAGLDPAFEVGGVGCKLRFAYMGHTTRGDVVLDFREEELMFQIDISAHKNMSGERQLALGVIDRLRELRCPLQNCAIDATGAGRPLAELILVLSGESHGMLKIVSVGKAYGVKTIKKDPESLVATPTELWFNFREFISRKQIKGLDAVAIAQFTSRLTKRDKKSGRVTLEAKDEYKARMNAINPKLARSPDEADAAVLALHAAIIRFGFHRGQRVEVPNLDEGWLEKMLAVEAEKRRGLTTSVDVNERIEAAARRPRLVPNFACGVEDLIDPRKLQQE